MPATKSRGSGCLAGVRGARFDAVRSGHLCTQVWRGLGRRTVAKVKIRSAGTRAPHRADDAARDDPYYMMYNAKQALRHRKLKSPRGLEIVKDLRASGYLRGKFRARCDRADGTGSRRPEQMNPALIYAQVMKGFGEGSPYEKNLPSP